MNIKNLYKQILSEFDDKMTGYPTQPKPKPKPKPAPSTGPDAILKQHGYTQDTLKPQSWYKTNDKGIVTHRVYNRAHLGPNIGNPKYQINIDHSDGSSSQREANTEAELKNHLDDIHK